MTARDEGQAALEAAVDAYHYARRPGSTANRQEAMRASIRAWLAALPGWRLVPLIETEEIRVARLIGTWTSGVRAAPPPPGLEKDPEHGG